MSSQNHTSTPARRNPIPVWVWVVTSLGAIGGALLAAPGNFVGNTLPSTATFAVAAFVIAIIVWRVMLALSKDGR